MIVFNDDPKLIKKYVLKVASGRMFLIRVLKGIWNDMYTVQHHLLGNTVSL